MDSRKPLTAVEIEPIEIPITRGYIAIVDMDDAARVVHLRWQAKIMPRNDGTFRVYVMRKRANGGKRFTEYMHRVVLNAKHGETVDHINGNPLDNRRCNLRIVSLSENGANRRPNVLLGGKAMSSMYKGVSWNNGHAKWQARLRQKSLGYFISETDAAKAYDRHAKQEFGNCARLNFAEAQNV